MIRITPCIGRAELQPLESRRLLAGDFGWALNPGGEGQDRAHAVAVNQASGDVYVIGTFAGVVDFDKSPAVVERSAVGANDLYLARYAPDASLAWVVTFGGSGVDEAGDIAIAPDGSLAVVGSFSGSGDFDPDPDAQTTLSAVGYADAFVARFTSSGDLIWARSAGGRAYDTARGVAVADDGTVYAVGQFRHRIRFGTNLDMPLDVDGGGWTDAFVWSLDADGSMHNAIRAGGSDVEMAEDVAVTPDGEVVIIGAFRSVACLFGTDRNGQPVRLEAHAAGGAFDGFVALYDDQLVCLDACPLVSTGQVRGRSIAADDSGIYVYGEFSGVYNGKSAGSPTSLFVQRLDGPTLHINGDRGQIPGAIALGGGGDVYVSGSFGGGLRGSGGAIRFSDDAHFDLVSGGGYDAFVARLRFDASSVEPVWTRRFGGASNCFATGVAVNTNDDSVYTAGHYAGRADFNPRGNVAWRKRVGEYDAWLVKLLA